MIIQEVFMKIKKILAGTSALVMFAGMSFDFTALAKDTRILSGTEEIAEVFNSMR